MTDRARWHLRLGWTALFAFALLGTVLEALHAVKAGFYLDVGTETRRLMWTLAHAHGGMLGLVHVAFAASLGPLGMDEAAANVPGRLLTVALLLMPLGFFLGGIGTFGGDPGVGVLLAPVGALALVAGLALVARAAWR